MYNKIGRKTKVREAIFIKLKKFLLQNASETKGCVNNVQLISIIYLLSYNLLQSI